MQDPGTLKSEGGWAGGWEKRGDRPSREKGFLRTWGEQLTTAPQDSVRCELGRRPRHLRGTRVPQGDRASGGQGLNWATVSLEYLVGGEVKNLPCKRYKSQSFKMKTNGVTSNAPMKDEMEISETRVCGDASALPQTQALRGRRCAGLS